MSAKQNSKATAPTVKSLMAEVASLRDEVASLTTLLGYIGMWVVRDDRLIGRCIGIIDDPVAPSVRLDTGTTASIGMVDFVHSVDEWANEAVEAPKVKANKPAPRKPSPRKPKADAPKADSPWVKGCTFTYVKADKSESQHRIVRTEGDHAIARALASGQERRWLLTTLDAMHQTKNVRIAK